MDDTKTEPTPREKLLEQRKHGCTLLADLHLRKRALATAVADADRQLAAVEADIDAIDKVLSVL